MLDCIGLIKLFSKFYDEVNGEIKGSFFVDEPMGDSYFVTHDEFEAFMDSVLGNMEDRFVIYFNRYILRKLYFEKGVETVLGEC